MEVIKSIFKKINQNNPLLISINSCISLSLLHYYELLEASGY